MYMYHVEQCCVDTSLHLQEAMFVTHLNTPMMMIRNAS